jgi:hypothetical protein
MRGARILPRSTKIRIREASVQDLNALNDLTLEMHSHLGTLVGIRFGRDELEEKMFEKLEDLENVYVAEVKGKIVG